MATMAALSVNGRPAVRNSPIPFLLSSVKKPRPQPLDLSSLAPATDTKTRALATRDANARPIHQFATAQSNGPDHQGSWPVPATAVTVELDIWSPIIRSARSLANFGPNQPAPVAAVTVELDIWSPVVRPARSSAYLGPPRRADDTNMQLDTPKTPNAPVPFLSRFRPQHANKFSVFQDNCRFEHPSANGSAGANPFSVLSGSNSNNINNNRGGFGRQPAAQSSQFSLSKETIQKDLAEERPSWILSAYGPGRDAPEQLWGGYPIEQSFEEIRLHYMMGEASGNAQGAVRPASD